MDNLASEIGEVKFSKIYVDRDWDGSIYLSVRGVDSRAYLELSDKEAKQLIKALKKIVKGGK